MRRLPFLLGWLMATLGIVPLAFAQWPQSADTNLVICNHNGEQVLPKIAATSDGGCFISWFDHASGNYDVYMQRLDGNGVAQWQENGLLISSHSQETWLTDYDMTVDQQDHAIVTFNDIRAGGDWDIYAYRISPTGQFVWGVDGLTISDNGDFEPDPRVCVTSSGNIVFAWQQELTTMAINLRKVTPDGDDVWTPPIVNFTTTFGVSIPRLAPADNDEVILQYLVHQGSEWWSPKHIYAQKFDSSGNHLWGNDGIVVSNAGGLGPQMRPNIVSDANGGVYSYWYDSHDANQLHVYAQHVFSDGTMEWAANGIRASMANELQMDPAAVAVGLDGVLLFYMTSDLDQNNWGLGGQAIAFDGERIWGDNGLAFAQLNDQQRFMVNAVPQTNGACVSYLEFLPGSNVNNVVRAFHVYLDGDMPWPPLTISSVVSAKGRLAAAINPVGQAIMVWSDQRSDANDIYLQNYNPDGTLGPFGNEPPGEFWRVFPQDSVISDSLGWVGWSESVDPDGDPVSYVVHLRSDYSYQFEPDSVYVYTTSDTTLDLEIMIPVSPLDEIFHFWWRVFATDGQDLVEAENGEGMFMLDIIMIAEKDFVPYPSTFSLSAYPNPFNPVTNIAFDLPARSFVTLDLYNLTGQHIATLVNGTREAARHTVRFDGSDLPSGMYFCQLSAGNSTARLKLLLLK